MVTKIYLCPHLPSSPWIWNQQKSLNDQRSRDMLFLERRQDPVLQYLPALQSCAGVSLRIQRFDGSSPTGSRTTVRKRAQLQPAALSSSEPLNLWGEPGSEIRVQLRGRLALERTRRVKPPKVSQNPGYCEKGLLTGGSRSRRGHR